MCWYKDFLSWEQPCHSHILLWPTETSEHFLKPLLLQPKSLNWTMTFLLTLFCLIPLWLDPFSLSSPPAHQPCLRTTFLKFTQPCLSWETILILWHADSTFYNPHLSELSWNLSCFVFWHLFGYKKRKGINVCVQSSCKVAQTFCKGVINFMEKELY